MENVVLRIEELRQDHAVPGYPVSLYRLSLNGQLDAAPLAEDLIPEDWSAEGPILDPVTRAALDTSGLRKLVFEEADQAAVFTQIGAFLHRLLMRGTIGTTWAQLKQLHGPARGFRTYLDIRPEALRALPWELIQEHPRPPLFLDARASLVRGYPAFSALEPCTWPLRILVVLGCAEEDRDIDWRTEVQAIKQACRRQRQAIDLHVLQWPTREELTTCYNDFKPDIIHFIGHGRADDLEGSYLEFSSADGEDSWTWTVAKILLDLQGHTPRLAFLNACHSAEPIDQDGFWSVSRAFADLGTPAVIGMHGAVSGKGAALFGAHVYDQLALGQPLDEALRMAREAVLRAQDGTLARDWCLACLTTQAAPDQVLPVQMSIPADRWPQVRKTFDTLKRTPLIDFVDREQHRREVWEAFTVKQKPGTSLLILKGEEGIGKSTLLTWYLEACTVQGHQVEHRDCTSASRFDFVELLRYIERGSEKYGLSIHDAIQPGEAFCAFHRRLNTLLKPDDAPGPAGDPCEDQGYRLSGEGGHENMIEQIAASFLECLQGVARESPLTIALDHLGGNVNEDHFKKYMVPLILHPVARGLPVDLHLALAVTDEQFNQFGLHRLAAEAQTVTLALNGFRRCDYTDLATDFLTNYWDDTTEINTLVRAFGLRLSDPWKPEIFRIMRDLVTSVEA